MLEVSLIYTGNQFSDSDKIRDILRPFEVTAFLYNIAPGEELEERAYALASLTARGDYDGILINEGRPEDEVAAYLSNLPTEMRPITIGVSEQDYFPPDKRSVFRQQGVHRFTGLARLLETIDSVAGSTLVYELHPLG